MDIYKLTRRFASIFGNYKFDVIRKLFSKTYETSKASQLIGSPIETNNKLFNSLQSIFKNVLKNSIIKTTQGKVSLIIKHCNENMFSAADLSKFIDRLKVEGHKIKMIFIDYLDCMTPSITRFGNTKEYDVQGTIVQELRALSRICCVPIITPTQNRRAAENIANNQSNESIGDSYKKVRFSDFIYMMRKRDDQTFLSEHVRKSVLPGQLDSNGNFDPSIAPEIVKLKDKLQSVLVPFEIQVTKSKDSEKDRMKHILFCVENLRFYNTVNEYLKDAVKIQTNSNTLDKDISLLVDLAISSVATSDIELFDDGSNIDNIIQFQPM